MDISSVLNHVVFYITDCDCINERDNIPQSEAHKQASEQPTKFMSMSDAVSVFTATWH